MAMRIPKVRYADADGVSIAYEVRGDGPHDVVRISGVFPSILARAIVPSSARVTTPLAAFARVIVLDRRGTGMSDPLTEGSVAPLEQQVADVVAVMDDAGSERAVIWGAADGGQVAMLFAAMYPERTTALVLTQRVRAMVPLARPSVRPGRGAARASRRGGAANAGATPTTHGAS